MALWAPDAPLGSVTSASGAPDAPHAPGPVVARWTATMRQGPYVSPPSEAFTFPLVLMRNGLGRKEDQNERMSVAVAD